MRMMKSSRGFTIIEVVVVVAVFLAIISILGPFVRMVKDRASAIQCENNLRRLSIALHTYASEHEDAFPPDLGALYPDYVGDQKVFDCAASGSFGTPEKPDYSYAPGLTESSLLKTPIVEDAAGNHGRKGKNILRVDGSVEWAGRRF
ncbi:MAG: type II secretion system protein [Candidatus Omnitrophota bacterium]